MIATATRTPDAPDADISDRERAPRLKLTFSGESLKSVREAAEKDGANPGDFVRRAIRTVIYLKRMESRGYTVCLSNSEGAQVPLELDLLSL